MVSVEDAVIARISRGHESFEILVDPEMALRLKKGESVSIDRMLAVNQVFKDARKGERVSPAELERHFGTSDLLKVAEKILREGDVQLKTEQRREMVEEKRRQIAAIISKQGMDPKTRLPHPVQRILNAMNEAHVNIDPFKPANSQVKPVLEKIVEIIPISMDRVEVAVKIPTEFAGKASHIIREITDIKREEWKSDHWFAVIEIPAGMQGDIYEKLNSLTSGRAEVKLVKEKL
jgi:ribosome maturation protein SDO1